MSLRELGSSSGGAGAVGGTDRLRVSSAAEAMKAVQMGSVGMLCLTRNIRATCRCSKCELLGVLHLHTTECTMALRHSTSKIAIVHSEHWSISSRSSTAGSVFDVHAC